MLRTHTRRNDLAEAGTGLHASKGDLTMWKQEAASRPDNITSRLILMAYCEYLNHSCNANTRAREILQVSPEYTAQMALRRCA